MKKAICSYRNCNSSFETKRNNQVFCCSKCRNNEKKYRQRELKAFKLEKLSIKQMLNDITSGKVEDTSLINLWRNIYHG